jgi:hypothetical protein
MAFLRARWEREEGQMGWIHRLRAWVLFVGSAVLAGYVLARIAGGA